MPRISHLLALATLLLCLSFSATALADQPSTADALQHIRSGNDAFDEGDYETAYEHYLAAHDILPEQAIRYRLGQSAMRMGQVRNAIYHFEAFLQESEDEDRLARVQEWLPELRANIPAIVTVTTRPEGAAIFSITEEEEVGLGRSPGEFEVAPGTIRLEARAPNYETDTFEATAEPGEELTWGTVLTPRDAPPVEDGEGPSTLTIAGWTSTGLGVALLATGGAFSFLQMQSTNLVNEYDKQADGASRGELEAFRSDAETYHGIARISYVAGGVLAATGIGLLVYEGMQDDSDARVSLSVGLTPDGGALTLGGRF